MTLPGLDMHIERRSMTDWFVYLLRCKGGRLYCGISTDPGRRAKEHAEGKGGRFTRAFPPEELVWTEGPMDHGGALRREREIKRMKQADKDRLIKGGGP